MKIGVTPIAVCGPSSGVEAHPTPLLVNLADAAKMLAVSRTTLYQLIWSEELVPIRIGRSVRFSVAQLEQFVASRTAPGPLT